MESKNEKCLNYRKVGGEAVLKLLVHERVGSGKLAELTKSALLEQQTIGNCNCI